MYTIYLKKMMASVRNDDFFIRTDDKFCEGVEKKERCDWFIQAASFHYTSMYYVGFVDVAPKCEHKACKAAAANGMKLLECVASICIPLVYGWANLLFITILNGKLFNELEFMRGFCFVGCRLMKIYIRLELNHLNTVPIRRGWVIQFWYTVICASTTHTL